MANQETNSDITARLDEILEVLTDIRDTMVERNQILTAYIARNQRREALDKFEIDPPIRYGPKALLR